MKVLALARRLPHPFPPARMPIPRVPPLLASWYLASMAEEPTSPDAPAPAPTWLADALPVVTTKVSTRVSRWAPWVGALVSTGVALAGGFAAAGVVALGALAASYAPSVLRRRHLRRLRPDDVVEAQVSETDAKGTTLVLRTADGTLVETSYRKSAHVRRQLEELGLDRRRLAVVSVPELQQLFTGFAYWIGAPGLTFGAFVTAFDEAVWAPLIVLFQFAMVPVAARAVPLSRRVVIGADGVRIGRTFLSAKDIDTAFSKVRWEIVIRTKDGKEHVAMIGTSSDERVAWLVERIRAVARDPLGDAEVLARGKRDLASWKKDLESKVRAGYRDGALTSAQLERVLDDPSATPDRRLGAALALLAATPEAQRPAVRVRVAELGEAAADERLADAFEELAKDALTPRTAERVRER